MATFYLCDLLTELFMWASRAVYGGEEVAWIGKDAEKMHYVGARVASIGVR
jgi:hypothetical protein